MTQTVKYDSKTAKWFHEHPLLETTVIRCELCGLFYKPSLGHSCNVIRRKIGGTHETD